MASSGYTAITFVANEQPTTAKWNLIGSNDSSFNLGTGFEDGVIVNRHLSSTAVKRTNVDYTNWLMLGNTKYTASNFTTSSTTPVEITGMATAITVPTGCTNVLVLVNIGDFFNVSGAGYCTLGVWLDTFGGTMLGSCQWNSGGSSSAQAPAIIAITVPITAGAHTIRVGCNTSTGTMGLELGATRPASVIVLPIG